MVVSRWRVKQLGLKHSGDFQMEGGAARPTSTVVVSRWRVKQLGLKHSGDFQMEGEAARPRSTVGNQSVSLAPAAPPPG
jgi:hypothetical protein